MNSKGLWYFAHPYTAKDADGHYVYAAEEANFRLCAMRAGELLKRGYNIYAPIVHSHPIHSACPDFLRTHEHEIWYGLDNQVIARTSWDGIILAPGWEFSGGCKMERRQFEERDLVVRLYDEIMQKRSTYWDAYGGPPK